jgi:hypothetical protein
MIVPYSVYDTESGEILKSGTAPLTQATLQAAENNEAIILEQLNDVVHYVDVNLQLGLDKSDIPYVLTGSTISNLPVCVAIFETDTVSVSDGVLNVDVDVPGLYEVLLKSPIYLDTTVSVVVE